MTYEFREDSRIFRWLANRNDVLEMTRAQEKRHRQKHRNDVLEMASSKSVGLAGVLQSKGGVAQRLGGAYAAGKSFWFNHRRGPKGIDVRWLACSCAAALIKVDIDTADDNAYPHLRECEKHICLCEKHGFFK